MASGSRGFAGPARASSQVWAPLRPQSCPWHWLPSLGVAGWGDQEEAVRSHQLLLLALSLSPQEAFPWSSWPRGAQARGKRHSEHRRWRASGMVSGA